jgi:F-type H+-transporting ATPase subunit gamma
MSSLSALRQRIATVATIKKTTHAMRLIAMSNHARLRGDLERLRSYSLDVARICSVQSEEMISNQTEHTLFIIIGSEKGLCGSFNTALFDYCAREIFDGSTQGALFIPVGKQAYEYLQEKKIPIFFRLQGISVSNFREEAHNLAERIAVEHPLDRVIFVLNESKTFFVRTVEAREYYLDFSPLYHRSEVHFEGDVQKLRAYRERLRLKAFILQRFGESLIAEQAARFMSMDLSTRNAEALLERMRLDYNKMRQALITRELNDLTSAL